MPAYRSRTTTHGRNMAGARGLWRATGMKDADFLCGGGNQIRRFDNTEGILLALLDPYCTDPAPNGLVRDNGTTSWELCCQLLFCFVQPDILISGSTHFNGGIWFMAPSGK